MKAVNQPRTRFKRILETIGIFLSVAVVMYGFLALCNWSPYLKDWSGFSRFLMGVWGVIFLIRIIDDV